MALCLGIPARRKGFDRAMEAIVAHPNIHLVLAGSSDRWVAPRVKQLQLQDRVHILPYADNVMDLLSAADIFLHPAREEAAGIVIGEALAGRRAGDRVVGVRLCAGSRAFRRRHRAAGTVPDRGAESRRSAR